MEQPDAKTHYTARELAGLPGLPGTDRAVKIKADRESWPNKKRPGQGGPIEYPVACLPELTRAHLARKTCKIGYAAPVVAKDEKDHQRREARQQSMATFDRLPAWQKRGASAKLIIIQACATYIDIHGLAKSSGQDTFTHEYNMGRVDVAPWVRQEVRSFNVATLRAWIKSEHDLGTMGLADLYGNRKGQSKIETNPALKKTLVALMLDKPHIKAKHAHEEIRALCPDAPSCSVKSVERYMDRWKAENLQEYTLATNPDAFKNKFQAAFGSRSEGITGPNQKWEIDATPADLLLVDGRYKIIGLCDVGTRRLIFLVTKTERATDNAACVRRALIAWGVPELMVTDNGNPYKSDHFMRVMSDLEVQQHFCRPFSGDEKPHIERAFGTFSHDLIELLPGYCGHSVAERKEIEARKSFAQRLKDPEEVIEIAMTAADLQAHCDRWAAAYHNTKHSTLGRTPNQVVAEWPGAIHKITDERALDVLLAEAPRRSGKLPTVQKKGIKLDNGTYIHGDLESLIGQQVRVLYDPVDLGRIIVHALNAENVWEFACIAEDPDRTGISRAEVAAVGRARQDRHKAEMRAHAREAKKALTNVDIVQAVLEHREKEYAEKTANVTPFPRPTLDYTTPGLQAASEAARVLDRRAPEIDPAAALQRDRFVAQIEAPAIAEVFDIPFNDRDKYRLWCTLDGLIIGGEELGDAEMRFYEAFRKTPVYRAFRGIDEDIYSLRRD